MRAERFEWPWPPHLRVSRLAKTVMTLATGVLLTLQQGCNPPPDHQALFDKEVEEMYFLAYDQLDAVQFFRSGGRYVDVVGSGEDQFDGPYVLPLLEALDVQLHLKFIACVEKGNNKQAVAVVAKLPSGVRREQVEQILVEKQKTFPGDILQQWGHTWVSLDFLSPGDMRLLEDAGPAGLGRQEAAATN